MLTLALLVAGMGGVKAETVKLYSTGFTDNNGSCKYEGGKFLWWASYSNTIRALSFEAGTLSYFSKIKFTCTPSSEGTQYRVLVKVDGDNTYQKEITTSGSVEINIADLHKQYEATIITAEQIATITEVRIGGVTFTEGGTEADPKEWLTIDPTSIYLESDYTIPVSIANETDWTALSKFVNAGLTTLNAQLTSDITISDGKMIGSDSKPYGGTFNGQGHTIDFTYSGSESLIGPFRYVNAATITDLKTTGSITSSNNLLGGIIGKNTGASTLTRCWSSMSITSTDSSNGRVGGLVGRCADNSSPATNTIVFNYCVYDGNISTDKSGYACGFIGWDNISAATLNNCLVASSDITGGGNNFTNQAPTIPEGKYAYYITKFGSSSQGTQLNKQLLTSGQAAWELNQDIGDGAWFFGQGKLNTSTVDAYPYLTNDNTKKVVRTKAPYTSTQLYVNPGGAVPNAVRLKALGWYIGEDESDVLTSIPSDFTGGDDALKRTPNYFKLKVGSAGATTLMVPFTTTSLPENVKAYNLNYTSGDKVTATEVSNITADKPVLINAPAGEYVFSAAATGMSDMTLADGWITYGATSYTNGALTGVYNEVGSSSSSDPFSYVPANSYVLQNGTNGIGFYKVASNNTIKITSFRAYLTAESPARNLQIVFDNESTGILSIDNGQLIKDNEVYDLQGRRVMQPTKGIYVKNGKKIFVK